MDKTCFAYSEKAVCTVLTAKRCQGCECSFFKTPEKAEESRKRANRRLASLDATTQAHIAETYYNGKMPWLKGVNKA
ncbi:MAG: hypothetical protein ACOYU3_07460 [Bacillota bacterium]